MNTLGHAGSTAWLPRVRSLSDFPRIRPQCVNIGRPGGACTYSHGIRMPMF